MNIFAELEKINLDSECPFTDCGGGCKSDAVKKIISLCREELKKRHCMGRTGEERGKDECWSCKDIEEVLGDDSK